MNKREIKDKIIAALDDPHLDEDYGLELDPEDEDSILEYIQDLLDTVGNIVSREI